MRADGSKGRGKCLGYNTLTLAQKGAITLQVRGIGTRRFVRISSWEAGTFMLRVRILTTTLLLLTSLFAAFFCHTLVDFYERVFVTYIRDRCSRGHWRVPYALTLTQ
jgi:hypothetical protein